jgi:hypothetical protein
MPCPGKYRWIPVRETVVTRSGYCGVFGEGIYSGIVAFGGYGDMKEKEGEEECNQGFDEAHGIEAGTRVLLDSWCFLKVCSYVLFVVLIVEM